MKKVIWVASLAFVLMAKPVHIDEILTKENSVKVDMTVSYLNMQRVNGVSSSYTYQTENGDFVVIPTYRGDTKINQDYLNYAFILRYGISKDLELFTSVNLYSLDTHSALGDDFTSESSSGFNGLYAGLTYQLKKESETPSLIMGLSANILEKTKFKTETYKNKFKSYRVFATSFYTVDPVVFLLTTSYGINLKKEFKDSTMQNGNVLTISPQLYFTVNPYTSLNWGVKYTNYRGNEINKKQVSSIGSSITFLMGMSYEFSAKTIFNVNAQYLNTNDTTQSTVSTTFSYKF